MKLQLSHPILRHLFGTGLFLALTGGLLIACGQRASLSLMQPNGVAQAADGTLFIMDFGNHRIAHMSQNGKLIRSIGTFGANEAQIFHGYDLAIGPDGNIYICNMVSNDEGVLHDGIKVFGPGGSFVREIGGHDYDVTSLDPSYRSYGLDIDKAGRIYTADYGTTTVRVFTNAGELLAELPIVRADGEIPTGINDIAVDDARNLIYISDFDLGKIDQFSLTFDTEGIPSIAHLTTIATYGREAGEVAFPQYLDVNDTDGTVFVGDMANRRIQIFDAQGSYVANFAPPNLDDWQNMGINLTPTGDLLVADAFNNAIWIFTPEGIVRNRVEGKP